MKKAHSTHEVWTAICLMAVWVATVTYFNDFAYAFQNETSAENLDSGAREAAVLEDQEARLSYALGMVLGRQFRDRSVQLNIDLYVRGLKDGLGDGKTLLSREEAQAAVNALQRELRRKQTRKSIVTGSLAEINVAFKLDPRLTRAQYMGDRWVSPSTFKSTLQKGKVATVEAKAQGVDTENRSVAVAPKWIPSDPKMVTVSPGKGAAVKIIVSRAGESDIEVIEDAMTKKLHIKARNIMDGMQVEISQ